MTMLETWLYSMAVYNFWSYSSTIPYVKAITSAITRPLSYHYWLFLTIRKHFQTFPDTSDHIQPFMSILSHFRLFLATCDSFQPLLMTISYHSWLFLTITKHFQTFQPLLITSIHLCQFSAIFCYFCDPIWPLPPTSDDPFWQLMTISDHLKVPNLRGRHLAGYYYIQLT